MSAIHRAVVVAAAVLASGCASAPERAAGVPGVDAEFREQAAALDAEMRRWLGAEGPRRKDGYLYGLDVAPFLLYAAQRRDPALYRQLQPHARRLIVQDARDPYARGFVLWRQRDGETPEVSGAAEALWMARALWTGAAAFGNDEDRALALSVLDGYARHAYEQDGVWFVRKYFAFAGRSFASLSHLPAYHPDFLAQAEREVPRDTRRGLAERSYAVLERARAPSGLLKPVIQPEIAATWPELGLAAYAPDGVAPLQEACFGAEGALAGKPALADALLDFARDDDHTAGSGRLHAYFRAADGAPVGITELSSAGYACLGRLAAARRDGGAFRALAPWLKLAMRDVTRVPSAQAAPLYDGAQLLLAAQAAGAFTPPR